MSSTPTNQSEQSEPSIAVPSRRALFRVGSVLLGLFVAMAFLEISLWVFDVEPTVELTKRNLRYVGDDNVAIGFHCYPSNPNEEFGPLPDITQGTWTLYSYSNPPEQLPLEAIEETPWCVVYQRNRMGSRGGEFSPQPAEGVVRIAVVGDSFVFGEGVQIDGSLPVQLNQRLGPRYELLNLGQVGASTEQEMVQAYGAVENLATRRILLVFLLNDIGQTRTLSAQQDYINDLIIFRDAHLANREENAWYKGHLRLLDFVGSRIQMRRIEQDTIGWYRDCYDPSKNGDYLLQLEGLLHELSVLPECRVAMVLYPLMEGFESEYPFAEIHQQVSDMAARAGLPVLDLAPVFSGLDSTGLWVHAADHHPNRRAHGIAAKAIVSWLRRDLPDFLKLETSGDTPTLGVGPDLAAELPGSVEDDLAQGAALVRQGQLFDARLHFVRALGRDPNNAIARLYLGIIADNERKLTEAVVHYREALRLRPGWADAANNLASTLVVFPTNLLRDVNEPTRLAESACQATDYTSIRHLDTLIAAYGQSGRYAEAVETALWTLDLEGAKLEPAIAEQVRLKLQQYRTLLAEHPPQEDDDEPAGDGDDTKPAPASSESPEVATPDTTPTTEEGASSSDTGDEPAIAPSEESSPEASATPAPPAETP